MNKIKQFYREHKDNYRYFFQNKTNLEKYGSLCPLANKEIQKKAEETLKAMVPNLKHYGPLVSEGDFEITLRDLMDWEIISFKPTGITGVQISEIQKSPAWKEHCE